MAGKNNENNICRGGERAITSLNIEAIGKRTKEGQEPLKAVEAKIRIACDHCDTRNCLDCAK